jgi:DNA-binding beta-propeller fold protein YncE
VVQEGPGKVVLFPIRHPRQTYEIKVGDKAHEIAVSPDGHTAYVSNFGLLEANHKEGVPGTTISMLDMKRHVELRRFILPAEFTAPHGVKLRPPRYRELFTNAEEGPGGMVVFSADTGAVLRTFPLPAGVHNFVFNADGSSLFAFTLSGDVCRIDPETGKVLARVTTGSPRGLAWTADGRFLIVSGKGELVFLDPGGLSIAKRIGNLGVGQIFYPSTTQDGHWLLAPAVLDGVVLIIDASSGAVHQRVRTGSPLVANVDPDGRRIWVSNVRVPAGLSGAQPRAGGLTIIDLKTFRADQIQKVTDTNGLAITSR